MDIEPLILVRHETSSGWLWWKKRQVRYLIRVDDTLMEAVVTWRGYPLTTWARTRGPELLPDVMYDLSYSWDRRENVYQDHDRVHLGQEPRMPLVELPRYTQPIDALLDAWDLPPPE